MKTNFILSCVIGFLSGLLVRNCINNKTIRHKEKHVIDTILRTDTVINRQTITRKKIIQKLDTLYKILEVPRNILVKDSAKCDSLYTLCLEQKQLISLDDSLICNYSNQVENYKHLVKIKNNTIDSLSTNKKYFKGLLHGFVIGAGVVVVIKR